MAPTFLSEDAQFQAVVAKYEVRVLSNASSPEAQRKPHDLRKARRFEPHAPELFSSQLIALTATDLAFRPRRCMLDRARWSRTYVHLRSAHIELAEDDP